MKTHVKIVIGMFAGMIGSAIVLFNAIASETPSVKLALIGLSGMLVSVTAGSVALKNHIVKQDDAGWRI